MSATTAAAAIGTAPTLYAIPKMENIEAFLKVKKENIDLCDRWIRKQKGPKYKYRAIHKFLANRNPELATHILIKWNNYDSNSFNSFLDEHTVEKIGEIVTDMGKMIDKLNEAAQKSLLSDPTVSDSDEDL